jgi:UTP--glucose-1-phosphate uridylyltransferase
MNTTQKQDQTDKILKSSHERMVQAGDLDNLITKEFERRLSLVASGYSGKIPWNEVHNPAEEDLLKLEDLEEPDSAKDSENLSQLVIIKLNGGLGTSMGLSGAKSLIPVKEKKDFLYYMKEHILHLRRKYNTFIPLLFMNSFSTREDTLREPGILHMNENPESAKNLPPDFLQNKIPRISAHTFMPVGSGNNPEDWCPPGHGDIYLSLRITGILDQLIESGFKVAFISNSDNLAATVNTAILNKMLTDNLDFCMEITPKTLADIKGGALCRRTHEGRVRVELIEAAQVADEHIKDFQDIQKFAYFNTNNLWISLLSLRKALHSEEGLALPVIVNQKTLDSGEEILQLETAMGAAIGSFEKSRGVIIPRSRFAPVKTCADLLVRRSDAYIENDDATLSLNTKYITEEPVIKLSADYKKIGDFEKLFIITPSLQHCRELTVSGPVLFDQPVEIHGAVTVINESKSPVSVSKSGKSVFTDEVIRI